MSIKFLRNIKNHFKKERQEITDELLAEVKDGESFSAMSFFEINVIEVSKYDDNTIYLKIDGNDVIFNRQRSS